VARADIGHTLVARAATGHTLVARAATGHTLVARAATGHTVVARAIRLIALPFAHPFGGEMSTMRHATEVTPLRELDKCPTEPSAASLEKAGEAAERFSIAGNGQHADSHGLRRYTLAPAAAPEPESLIRVENATVRIRQPQFQPAREVTLAMERLDAHLVAFHDFDPRAAAQYNRLAIALIAAVATRQLQRILLASAQHGEGRTCVTLNLAAALARARQRVLVIDSDLLRPSALRLLGVDAEIGLAEAITGGRHLGEALMRLMPIDFNLLPTRARVENAAELLASSAFGSMLQMLAPDYDFILFDSAPLLSVADANLLALHSDAALLVVRPGHNSPREMAQAIALLDEERLFGAVLNRVVS
jgi:capsular exopolysaccharide synthesis family protein